MTIDSKVLIGIILLSLISSIIYNIIAYNNIEHHTITISEKTVKRNGESDKYLVFTKQGDVYCIQDALFIGRFDSSNDYGKLQIDSTYRIKTMGYRIPFLSKYKNILTAHKK